ncbi:MAG: cytochrome C oxidase subunit IV family protein [Sediminibacterium sp.]|nr:cytochrome C oxidase subunit IV family protein [Sediminibacterium sp.]
MESPTPHVEHHSSGSKLIWKVTIILSVLTIIELCLGFWLIGIETLWLRHFIKGIIVILMISKAYYIVGYFMHLKHEINNFVLTVLIPLFIFVWFIIAFIADGESVKNLRTRYDPYFNEQTKTKVEQTETNNHSSSSSSTESHK